MNLKIILFGLIVLCSGFCKLSAQPKQPVRVLIIFDVSKSMSAPYQGSIRMDAAKQLAYSLVDSLGRVEKVQMALRVYGPQVEYPPGGCTDTRLVIPFRQGNAEDIKQYVYKLQPTGITPIAYSLEQSVKDFTEAGTKNFIVIITDGIEECNGDICAAAKKVWEKGIVLRPFIIGIGLTEEQSKEFECVGNYFNADETTFTELGKVIITQIMNPTTAQINLLDKQGLPTETNVAMTFFDLKDGLPEYNFIHTLNRYDNPDTMFLDVYRDYRIKIYTIPPVEIDTAKQSLGNHNIFAVDAAQGELRLEMPSALINSEPICLIRKDKHTETLNYQKFNKTEKYLCGTYDLEIMTLPRIIMEDVIINPEGKTIRIPASGELRIQSGKSIIGSVMQVNNDGSQEWVCNLPTEGTKNFSVYLQPGNYVLVYREKNETRVIYSVNKRFTVRERNVTNIISR